MRRTWTGSEMLQWIGDEQIQASFVEQARTTALERIFSAYHDFINSSLVWSDTTEGRNFWLEQSMRRDTPDYVEINGQIFHVSSVIEFSEHSSRHGEIIDTSTSIEDDACKCLETDEWFDINEAVETIDSWGHYVGYVSNHWLQNFNIDSKYVTTHDDRLIRHSNAILVRTRTGEKYFPSTANSCIHSNRDDMWFDNLDTANHFDYYYREHADDYLHIDEDDFDDPEDDYYECESSDAGDYNAGYHNLNREWKTPHDTKFTVGFEIEKEDNEVACKYHYQELYNRTKWCKERDGSLDDNSGYELVSPVLNLFDNSLEREIKDSAIEELINAEYSTSTCGGHINLGSSEYTPEELFEGMAAFYPLLYAMYPYRISKNYSKAKKKHHYYDKEKYSAIYMRDHVLEFRIFSGVKNTEQLIWRRDLIRIFCDNINKSESDVLRMLIDHRSKLYKHLRKVYSQETLIDKTELFINHVREWNNKKLPPIDREQLKKDNINDNAAKNAA